jgi:adenylate cyclase
MIRAPVGRYIRYWYTYRTAVAVLIAILLSGAIYWLYTQQLACDAHESSCVANISVHPQDRFVDQLGPGNNVVIVGIDDRSLQEIKQYPPPRDVYAQALVTLQSKGAQVIAFDVGFPDPREAKGDLAFAKALAESKVPIVLSYGASTACPGLPNCPPPNGKVVQQGIDQIPLKLFRCKDTDPNPDLPCRQPYANVILASTDLVLDADGVTRRIPLFVQPACFASGRCTTPVIDSLGFAAYRAFFDQSQSLRESNGTATFGSALSVPVDSTGSALINFTGPPNTFKQDKHYVSFSDVLNGSVPRDAIDGKIVLVGYYQLSGVNDQQLVTTSAGQNGTLPMAGVEIHANVVDMLLGPHKLLSPEPAWMLFAIVLVLGLATAIGVSRVSVLWGLVGTVVALVLFTLGMSYLANFNGLVPDLFHPWLAIALTYSGVTAYRFLYEDREKRKVTRVFGQFLKPEIVAQLARNRAGVEAIMRGGERRDLTLLFADIRGFTSMSEKMAAPDVTEVVQMYLDHLSGIIFTWDGTLDKYVGDEIVAFWNAPRLHENHALLALRCAYDLVNRAPELEQRLLAKGLPPVRWGIGINTGPAVVGMMGSRSRIQYTALGDTVNTAARFCAHAPGFHVLIGQLTYEMCKDYIAVDLVPGVQLKGKSAETFRIYQVTAIRETPSSPWVPFPSQMADQTYQTMTSQYTQQTVIAAGQSESHDILVGEEAAEALASQGPSPN